MINARNALTSAAGELERAGVPSPCVDAEWLLAHVLGVQRAELSADGSRELAEDEATRFSELVSRRAAREPLAYVLGEWGFRRLSLAVDRRVLVPRPETEIVVQRCLTILARVPAPIVLDIGVGSGAIALALAQEHPGALVVATDNSEDALAVADENRARNGLDERVDLVHGELFAGLAGPFDLIVSNPPYVDPDEIDTLDPEVAQYEPRGALVATGVTEAIVKGARELLQPGGALVLETADGKAGEVAALLRELGYGGVTISPDLAGRERVVDGRTRG